MIKEISKEKVQIICPHCSTPIDNVWVCEHQSSIGKRFIYFCNTCQKLLGISHHRGFSSELLKSSNSKNEISTPLL